MIMHIWAPNMKFVTDEKGKKFRIFWHMRFSTLWMLAFRHCGIGRHVILWKVLHVSEDTAVSICLVLFQDENVSDYVGLLSITVT